MCCSLMDLPPCPLLTRPPCPPSLGVPGPSISVARQLQGGFLAFSPPPKVCSCIPEAGGAGSRMFQPLRVSHGHLDPECGTWHIKQARALIPAESLLSEQFIPGSFQVFQVTTLHPGNSGVYFRVICAASPSRSQSAYFGCLSEYSALITRTILNPQSVYYTAAGHWDAELCCKALGPTGAGILQG